MSTREDREADARADAALPPDPPGPLVRFRRYPAVRLPSGAQFRARDYVEVGYRNDPDDVEWLLTIETSEIDELIAQLQAAKAGRAPVFYA